LKEFQNRFRKPESFSQSLRRASTNVCGIAAKALELFMISLVTKAAAEARSRSSKRVSAVHLKQAVTKDEQFDFLSEIVSKVAEAPAAAEKSEDTMEVEGKKRKGGGRKKRKADDDDF
jgi:Dr1-associated corepressor